MKTCSRCSQELPNNAFCKSKNRSDGLNVYCRTCAKAKYVARGGRDAQREINRRSHLKRKYGMSSEAYDALYITHGGLCSVCRRPETARGRGGSVQPLSVDHCHSTGAIRGLLCNACNVAIGLMNDDPEVLRAAAWYIEGQNDT